MLSLKRRKNAVGVDGVVARATSRWAALRFRYQVVSVGSIMGFAVLSSLVVAYRASPRLGVAILLIVAGLCELGGIACVLLEIRDRGRTVASHLAKYRGYRATRPPLSTSEPFHPPAAAGRHAPPPWDPVPREIWQLQRRVDAVEFDIRQRLSRRINDAVRHVADTTLAGDEELEALVIALTKGGRGKSLLGVVLVMLGILIGVVANLWSMAIG